MPFFYFLIYLILCLTIGLVGKNQPLGFNGLFLLSFFLSPVVGIILLILLSAFTVEHSQSK
ncbi:MAG: hypothetical protein M0Q44_08535 [Methylobacter sp.]|jgi:hypothetical protein|nr:hypothetical protein [Methylobacter sp.]